MGRVADTSLVLSCDIYINHYGGRRVKATRRDISYWRTMLAAMWERDPKWHKFQGGSVPARSRQLGWAWSRLILKRPEELRET
jgi:hypothetical protein